MNPSNSLMRPPRILAVFAHPDDETLCAGGTLAKYAAHGAEIMVVSATRGDAGQIHDANAATRRTLGQIREQELRLACERLGIRQSVCLDYGDGTLDSVAPELLIRHITLIVRRFRPDIVITFGPDGAYGHPDHIAIGAATTEACDRAGDAAAFVEQLSGGLTPHRPEAVYHCYFPRSRVLLRDLLARCLCTQPAFHGSAALVNALPLLAKELQVLGLSADHVDVHWYADGFAILEQGEAAGSLYLILDGAVEVVCEQPDGKRHSIAQLQAGAFFGQHDLAGAQHNSAHVLARGSATCLVLAPGAPTAFAGRGGTGGYAFSVDGDVQAAAASATTAIDVSAYVERKVAALAAHRTQCPLAPDMLPPQIFQAVFSQEYFVRVEPARHIETDLLPYGCFAPPIRLHERRPVLAAA